MLIAAQHAARIGLLPIAIVLLHVRADDPVAESTVGMPARIANLVLPGPELEAVPRLDRAIPIVLRIVEVAPHGNSLRYELEFHGLDPGDYDLRDYLQRKDGSTTANLEPIPVSVRPILPPGQVEPHALEARGTPRPWGYRTTLAVGALLWLAGLGYLLFGGRKRIIKTEAALEPPKTLAERLRPLVEDAVAGRLEPSGRAELERLMIGYWRRRLALEGVEPVAALAILRDHDEAGAILGRLEDWLHRPPGTAAGEVDVAALLEPYRDLPSDEFVASGQGGAA